MSSTPLPLHTAARNLCSSACSASAIRKEKPSDFVKEAGGLKRSIADGLLLSCVLARAATKNVPTGATLQRVVTAAAVELVVAVATLQRVVALLSVEGVVAVLSPNRVLAAATVDHVVAATGLNGVVTTAALDEVVTTQAVEQTLSSLRISIKLVVEALLEPLFGQFRKADFRKFAQSRNLCDN